MSTVTVVSESVDRTTVNVNESPPTVVTDVPNSEFITINSPGGHIAVSAFSLPTMLVTDAITGPPGATGPAGPVGPGGADLFYLHDQSIPSASWDIVHNLGKFPSVQVVDSAGTAIFGADILYVSINEVIITFSASFGGKAYLN